MLKKNFLRDIFFVFFVQAKIEVIFPQNLLRTDRTWIRRYNFFQNFNTFRYVFPGNGAVAPVFSYAFSDLIVHS